MHMEIGDLYNCTKCHFYSWNNVPTSYHKAKYFYENGKIKYVIRWYDKLTSWNNKSNKNIDYPNSISVFPNNKNYHINHKLSYSINIEDINKMLLLL